MFVAITDRVEGLAFGFFFCLDAEVRLIRCFGLSETFIYDIINY